MASFLPMFAFVVTAVLMVHSMAKGNQAFYLLIGRKNERTPVKSQI